MPGLREAFRTGAARGVPSLKAHKREDGAFAGADNAFATYHWCIPA